MNILDKFKNITGNRSYQALNKKFGTLETTPNTPTNTQNGSNTALSVNNPTASQNTPIITPTKGNSAITSKDLAPKDKLNLPVDKPYVSPIIAEVQNQVENQKTASELAFEQSKKEKDTNVSETQKLLEDIGIVKGKSGQYAEEAGVNANQDQLDEINNALMVENRNLANITEKYLNDPSLHGGVGTRLAQKANADSARKQADLLVSQAILQGNVDRALKIAKQKVDDELAPIQAKIDGLIYARDLNKDVWSNAEKTKLDNIINKEQSALKETADNKKLGTEMIVNAQGYGATADIIKKAQDILNNGGTQIDVAQALGKYSSDPLERALKNAQLAKANKDNASSTGLRELDTTDYSKFTTNPNYKAIQDGAKFQRALADYKKAIEDYGTGEIFSAKGKGILGSTYQSLVATVKDYYTLGTLDAGVEKLVGLGLPKPDKLRIRDKRVISAVDKQLEQVKDTIQNSKNQLMNSPYKDTVELQSLLQESTPQSEEDYLDNVDKVLLETNNAYSQAGYEL